MASVVNILICSVLALFYYFCFGLPLAARVAPRSLAITLAPGIGWAVHSVIALPVLIICGMSRTTVLAVFAGPLIAALAILWRDRNTFGWDVAFSFLTVLAFAAAALLAFSVMAAIVPKVLPEGVLLASPIFDHSKVTMIDEMVRLGVPPGNPFFGGAGNPIRLSYYYLWHFSAAELAVLANISGWEADGGLTWFTAFASLTVMIGFAVWLSGRASASLWVVLLAATASIRPMLYSLFGVDTAEQYVGYRSGFGGWLFQTTWAPQHTASAMCAVLAVFLLVELATRPRTLALIMFALIMAAGFESSTWVGGIVLPVAAVPIALVFLAKAEPAARFRIVVSLMIAALLAVLLISPFLYDQLQTTALRGGGLPVTITPYEVLGENVTDIFGNIANWPAFWLVFLVVEFPAFYLTGLASLWYFLKDQSLPKERRSLAVAFALLLAASLVAAWLLVSTIGENNDLGWRAVLPAVMMLIVFAAVGLSKLWQSLRSLAFAFAILLVLLGIPDSAKMIYGNFVAAPNASAKAFAATPALWQAVRRHTATDERVANNPLFMEHMTPWEVNISWALLSDRRSCYASAALVGPFTGLPEARRDKIDAQFQRVFAGKAEPGDVADLATQYDCGVAVVTPEDGAWAQDPFADSPYYQIAESNAGWRIYKRVTPAKR